MVITKRFFTFLVVLLLLSTGCFANGPKSKQLQNELKKTYKQLKSEGWEVYGKLQTLEDALKKHYQALEEGGDSLQHIMGQGTAKSVDQAVKKAHTRARAQYASVKGNSQIEGITRTDMKTTQEGGEVKTQTEFDRSVQTKIDETVKGMIPTFTIYRTAKDGIIEAQAFFLVKQIFD